jgi:hypothetical protein
VFFCACLVPILSASVLKEGTLMLESLISSRIRRTLLEHLVKHPTERFYLRGLAKTLALPITPLRRELKRLQAAGMLQGSEEGNMLFYVINVQSSAFRQVQQAVLGSDPEIPAAAAAAPMPRAVEAPMAVAPLARRAAPLPASLLMVATALGLLVMVAVTSLAYLAMTNERLMTKISRVMSRPTVTVVTPPSAAGTMRGRQWQIVPGGFGGFSADAPSAEAY